MSEANPEVKAETKVEAKPAAAKAGAKAKKSWSNPALRAMGIPRISLPSRNWMIFWTVLTTIGTGIAYDKYQQKKIRTKWMEKVESLGHISYPTEQLPRKLTIYIAPPPNDFLDESLKLFKKFIKPVLNAGCLDFEIFSESRQGDIRSNVAQRIRDLRQAELDKQVAQQPVDTLPSATFEDEEQLVRRSELYKPKDVLGLYRIFPGEIELKSEDSQDIAGGIICIGRGAFKEYITGLHEGLLGPLTKPQFVIDQELKAEEELKAKEEAEESEEPNLKPVPKPYITPDQYSNAEFAPELNLGTIIKNNQGIPQFFEQPLYVFKVPNLIGFTTIPLKIYRYFTKRYLADDYGHKASGIVLNKTRSFTIEDLDFAKDEELEWPKKWVKTGLERNSEWVQEIQVDERIISRMKVFEVEE
ncbi:Mitochondrial import inner membrane translocase subunit TIM54 [Spathaspora sp. JA1]|nr:Mitochondrial import inner membrane translocase subunit TIM54 [Spathaspora sp. JA1]